MNPYERWILPHLTAWVMDNPGMTKQRPGVVGDVAGEVLELGFGAGLNLPFYGPAVTRLYAVDPDGVGWSKAAGRIDAAPFPVARIGLDGARLELDDDSVDHVVCTWTLCTIPDLDGALAEVRRVLRPGGTFRFIEHGRHPDDGVARWQGRVTPVWRAFAGGCHLDRDIAARVRGAGFELEATAFQQRHTPRLFGWMTVGVAR